MFISHIKIVRFFFKELLDAEIIIDLDSHVFNIFERPQILGQRQQYFVFGVAQEIRNWDSV